jgi:hypothetical protein
VDENENSVITFLSSKTILKSMSKKLELSIEFTSTTLAMSGNITGVFLFKVMCMLCTQVRWVSCHHSMVCLQVADGGDGLQILRVAVTILNEQSLTVNKGWSSCLGVGCGANTSLKKISFL